MRRHALGMLEPVPPTPAVGPAPGRRTVVEVWSGGAASRYRSDQRSAARLAPASVCPDCGGEGDVAYRVEAAGDEATATYPRREGAGTVPAPLAA